jgi:hypothetical protein
MKNKPAPALLRPSNLSNEIKKRISKSRETIPLSWLYFGHVRGSCLLWNIAIRTVPLLDGITADCLFKGTVQRELKWVKSGINGKLMISDCSAGRFFNFKGPWPFKIKLLISAS